MEDATTPAGTLSPAAYAPPPRRSSRGQLLVALLAFLLGAALVGWIVWQGYLEDFFPAREPAAKVAEVQPATAASEEQANAEVERQLEAVGGVEGRLAMLEDRLSRLDLQANAASGNAARAESLLIAFAARRMIDRGQPLRYLADQIQLRFANAQPRAVRTILEFAKDPVTVDQLSARLEALSPDLTGASPDASFFDKALADLSDLFTVRREPSEVIGPEAGVERARVMLRAGRIDDAVAQIQRLPGAPAADKWVSDARRYAEVQRALDLIETAAMLEPTRLQDAEGNRVDQPSPLATPTATADSARPKTSSAPK
ncbi:MAG: hypothetical protein KDE32_04915 [Novosphingobium sp.]|nr:hypothetical protein [Novosphingobium sp.]